MIYCDDSDNNSGILCVTENLYATLQRHRPVDQPITMWIDAICINQNDLEERCQQLLLMREIYSKSSRLFVWLGEDVCDTAFDYILTALREFGYPPGPDVHDTNLVKELVASALFNLTNEVSSSLGLFFGNNWFRRAWTFQGILSASEAKIFAGD